MYAEHADTHASVGKALSAGLALTASDVRINDHQLAYYELAALGRFRDMGCELMPEYTRIFEERLTSLIYMVVSAANSDASDIQPH
jgi:hypothetical protein